MAATETEAGWYSAVSWLEWLDEPSVVSRPNEDVVMRRLALQTVRAVEKLEQVREFIFRRAVKEVLFEARGLIPPPLRLTLREIHARRGVQLEWRTEVTKRGNVSVKIVEVEIPKAA